MMIIIMMIIPSTSNSKNSSNDDNNDSNDNNRTVDRNGRCILKMAVIVILTIMILIEFDFLI